VELTRPEPGVGVTAGAEPHVASAEPGAAIPIVEAEAGFELEEAYASPATQISEAPAPRSPESGAVPVVQIEEDFELERPGGFEAAAPIAEGAPARSAESGAVPVAPIEEDFELERPGGPEAAAPEAEASPAEASPPVSAEAGVAEPTSPTPEVGAAKAPPEQSGALADASAAFGSETVAMPAAVPMPRKAPAVRRPKSRLAEISPEHAAAAMGDLGGGKTSPLTSGTLAELYVSQGAPEKAIEIYQKVVADTPGDLKAAARLAALKAAAGPPAEPPAATARLSPREVRRGAIERTIERLEAFLAAVKERKVSP